MLRKTWRWFGQDDLITLDMLVQMGVEGVVTALHHIPNGEVWSTEEIMKVKTAIEAKGMVWSVVESLPVSEGIKVCSADRDWLIKNYQESVRNLGACGIDTICYNFMPVLDWARTSLQYKSKSGAESMYFDYPTFVAFDIFILKRPNAAKDYPEKIVERAKERFSLMTASEVSELAYNIIVKTQGFIDGVVGEGEENYIKAFLDYISTYKDIDKARLRENLKRFLDDIIPVAEESGVSLAIHPDDPPFQILGLPRIIGQAEDYEWLYNANTSDNNGITFCMGSLSALKENNLVHLVKQFGERIHFVHLRNTTLLDDGSFYESGHLQGSQDLVAIISELLKEQKRRKDEGVINPIIPFRPDHGLKILSDFDSESNPGYPLVGRLKGLAEIDGVMHGLSFTAES